MIFNFVLASKSFLPQNLFKERCYAPREVLLAIIMPQTHGVSRVLHFVRTFFAARKKQALDISPCVCGMTFPPRNSFGERKKARAYAVRSVCTRKHNFKNFSDVNNSERPINTVRVPHDCVLAARRNLRSVTTYSMWHAHRIYRSFAVVLDSTEGRGRPESPRRPPQGAESPAQKQNKKQNFQADK